MNRIIILIMLISTFLGCTRKDPEKEIQKQEDYNEKDFRERDSFDEFSTEDESLDDENEFVEEE